MVILVSVVLASCTMPTMPWTKTASTTDAEVVTDETSTDATTDEKMSGETTLPKTIPKQIHLLHRLISLRVIHQNESLLVVSISLHFYCSRSSKRQCRPLLSCELVSYMRRYRKDIKAHLKDIPKDVTILRVNYDDATDLKELYSVTGQYTFVQVDNSGKLIKKWRGGSTLKEVLAQLNGNLLKIYQKQRHQNNCPTTSWKMLLIRFKYYTSLIKIPVRGFLLSLRWWDYFSLIKMIFDSQMHVSSQSTILWLRKSMIKSLMISYFYEKIRTSIWIILTARRVVFFEFHAGDSNLSYMTPCGWSSFFIWWVHLLSPRRTQDDENSLSKTSIKRCKVRK